jgi:WhiB family redox-sensing transcriptional regulator
MMAGGTRPELAARVRRLRRLRRVPDSMLAGRVLLDGLIWQMPPRDSDLTAAAETPDPDRDLAARLCAGCPVQDECLELDLRWHGGRPAGVIAGLTESDRRALHPLWVEERASPPPGRLAGPPSS